MHEAAGPREPNAGNDARTSGPLSPGVEALYRHMVRLRLVSAQMVDLQREGAVAFHASSIGDEAIVAAVSLAARPSDWVFPSVRAWGAALVRGMPLAQYMHHAFGTASDPAKGHSAPDHPPARAFNVAPASGIPGAHLPQAVGFAWAARIRKNDAQSVVTLAIFDEETTTTGDFHNAMNFAGVFKVPCVLVCRSRGARAIAERAVAYGVAHATVDGGDPVALAGLLERAVARAAAGQGAILIEAVTSALDPAADDGTHRFGPADPLVRMRAGDLGAFEAETREEIARAVAAARAAPKPSVASMFEDVYAEVPAHLASAREKEATTWRR